MNIPSPAAPAPGAAGQFPYPGDPSALGSSSSSSRSSSNSPDEIDPDAPSDGSSKPPTPRTDTADSQGSVRRKLPKVKQLQSNEDREAEDLTVARFYRQSGNLQAAYNRTRDAIKMQPDDPEAHFALAEVAQHLQKNSEALEEYSSYLKLDPDGVHAKSAHKALSTLQ